MNNECLGKRVVVKIRTTGEYLEGVVLDKPDWLVGCPVFKNDKTGQLLGVGYECDVTRIIS